MDFVPLLVGAAMVAMLVDVIRSAKGGDWNGVLTPLVAFGAGVLVAWLLSESDFASEITIGDTGLTLANINGASLVLFGFAFATFAAKGTDLISAIAKRPNAKPSLIEGEPVA
jgi:hypothetical protein